MLGVLLFPFFLLASTHAAEPFFKKDDVIALVGGEDMVVASEYGYLELRLILAFPDYNLRFRNLAWESDTVYEQRRDLNFPTWEEQLEKIGATVVVCQFGAMESLDGQEKLPEFTAAYEKLIERFSAGGKRRVIVMSPTFFTGHLPWSSQGLENPSGKKYIEVQDELFGRRQQAVADYVQAERNMAEKVGAIWDNIYDPIDFGFETRDNIHLTGSGHFVVSSLAVARLQVRRNADLWDRIRMPDSEGRLQEKQMEQVRQLIVAKNKLWFDYWRVQNWAFLAGDRTNQPSSRDWRDPSKRWFPAEREEFIPLIEAKDKEIDALAKKLAGK